MPCLIVAAALVFPRLMIAYLWFFTSWLHMAFDGFLWPLAGFVFAPFSLLWYSVVLNHYGGDWGTLQIVVMVLAVLADLSPGKAKSKKK